MGLKPRTPAGHSIDYSALMGLAQAASSGLAEELGQFAGWLSSNPITVYRGPVVASGLYEPPAPITVIDGDLDVRGNVVTAPRAVENNFFIVLGNLSCDNYFLEEESTVFGSGRIDVRNLMYTATRDAVLFHYGPVKVRYLYSGHGGAWLSVSHDDVEIEVVDDYFERAGGGAHPLCKERRGRLSEMLVPGVLDFEEWDCLDPEERAELIEGGESKYDYCFVATRALRQVFLEGRAPLL